MPSNLNELFQLIAATVRELKEPRTDLGLASPHDNPLWEQVSTSCDIYATLPFERAFDFDAKRKECIAALHSVLEHAQVIKDTTVESQDALTSIRQRANEIAGSYRRATDALASHPIQLLLWKICISDDFLGRTERIAQQCQASADRAKQATVEADIHVAAIKSRAAVSVFASDFEALSRRQQKASRAWLATATAFAIAAVVVAKYMPHLDTESSISLAQAVVTKVAALSVITYALSVSVRNYRANINGAITNKHRATALTTVDRFVEAASTNKDIRDAIIVAAAQCVFAHTPSGFLSGRDQPNAQPPIANILSSLKT